MRETRIGISRRATISSLSLVRRGFLAMTRTSLRLVCAGLGSLLLALAAFYVRLAGPARLVILPITLGMLMLVPAALGERREKVEEACLRFRNAAFACFGLAIALLMFVMSLHDRHGLI